MASKSSNDTYPKSFTGEIEFGKTKNDVLGTGAFGTVYRGTYRGNDVAVKRIQLVRLDKKDREVKLQIRLSFENVLKIWTVEEDEDFRYIVLELCAGTLEDVCKGKYQGPILPSDENVVQQIIKGLNYLHLNNFVHQDIKPKKILISKTIPARVKLSDFGMSKEMSSSGNFSLTSGIKGTERWIAPELLNGSTKIIKGSSRSDIFSAGCVIFYFVTRGVHPFGDHITDVLKNITKHNPVNIERHGKDSDPTRQFLIDIAREMIEGDPEKRSSLEKVLKKTGKFIETASKSSSYTYPKRDISEHNISKADILGQGTFGTVYCGTYRGNDVAVKRIELARLDKKDREVKLQTQLRSDNVLKILTVVEDEEFRYIVLELCAGTLEDVCKGKYQGPTLPSDENVVQQIIKGLNYLHLNNLVHRDIKPANILISKAIPITVKLSDFGMSKEMSSSGKFSLTSGIKGTEHWIAPELLIGSTKIIKGKSSSDIFSAGCVIFYFVTRGVHPFGDHITDVKKNITENKPVNIERHRQVSDPARQFLIDIASEMIEGDPEKRSSLDNVLKKIELCQQQIKPFTGKFKEVFYGLNLEDLGEPCTQKCKPEADPSEDGVDQLLARKRLRVVKNQIVLRKGTFYGRVVRGFWRETRENKEIEVAVRKIRTEDCQENWMDIIEKHQEGLLDHNNVLKVFGFDENLDRSWRYFAVELFHATLEQLCNGRYMGPMPSDAQVLCQIANGINFLHSKKLTHGQLNPNTILIAQSIPVRMKVSEFGLSRCIRSQTKNFQTRFGDMQDDEHLQRKGLKSKEDYDETSHPTCWMLPGSWSTTTEENGNEIITPDPTVHGDEFAAGCIFFNFLTKGSHPFVSPDTKDSILENIKTFHPVNLTKLDSKHFAFQSIKDLIGKPPEDKRAQRLRNAVYQFRGALPLKVDESRELGRGNFGIVYAGTYEGYQVAVKKISVGFMKKEEKREMEEHIRLHHENVIKLLHIDEEKNVNFRYLVLELCAGTLRDYCEKKYWGPELPPDGIVLYQIANGLHYIHSRNLVHRDVKPDNILIPMTTPVQMKLSDFGLVKKVSPQGTFSQSGLKGTHHWMAPEILELINHESPDESTEDVPHGTIHSDTFSAGCVFFYFLTRGSHPFGKSVMVPSNIFMNKPVELIRYTKDLQGDDRFLYHLIGEMIRKKEERITMPKVIKKLAGNLTASRYFRRCETLKANLYVSRFHPTEPVLACGVDDKVILWSAANSSIPFSNWSEMKIQLHMGNKRKIYAMKWNLDGTQLAVICNDRCDVIVWSYPSGEILFQMNLPVGCNLLKWNPFRPNVFATFFGDSRRGGEKFFFFNSCPVDQRTFHFCTIIREEGIRNVEWISENQVAVASSRNGIETLEIDESTATAPKVQKLEPDVDVKTILDVVWNERTKCLVTCSLGGMLKIFSMDSDQPIHRVKVDRGCCRLAWRPNEKETDDEGIDAVRESPDNFILACGFNDGRIVIWTPLKEETTRFLKKHPMRVDTLSFSPDGRFLASADDDRDWIIWSTENWNPVYIGDGQGAESFSWMSPSTDVPEYKLTFNSSYGKVQVIESVVGDCEIPN